MTGVALVTGASEGIGLCIADTLAAEGFTVYGTSRSKRPDRGPVRMRVLEVLDDASVEACIQGIEAEAGPVDLLVNNAAFTLVSPSEELPMEEAMRLMNTNFFGAVRVTRAVLPSMRARGRGRLIFISSLAGLMGLPGQSFYCASKHALEAYADALFNELAGFGVHVTLVEPGSHKTNILQDVHDPSWGSIEDYDGVRDRLITTIQQATDDGAAPQQVADLVARIAKQGAPPLRSRVNGEGYYAVFAKTMLPEKAFYRVLSKRFGMT